MRAFDYTAAPSRVIFGAGSLQHLGREIERLGAQRALVLSTPEQAAQAQRVADMLGSKAAGIFARAVMHVPIETAREARVLAQQLGADCAVVIGGGSTIGLGKAVALDSALPILAIPTTYAGSEMTPIYGITEAGLKKTGRDARVLPRTVIYDPDLSLSLPWDMTVTSAINAIAHAAEGLYAQDRNPVMDLMAEEGIRAMAEGVRRLKHCPMTSMRAAIVFTARGCAAACSAASAWPCTTSCATPWAAASTCRTRQRTPSSCRMPWPTTLLPCQRPCSAWAVPWRVMRLPCHKSCLRWRESWVHRLPSATSACKLLTSTAPPISPAAIPTGTRAP
jgi:alcohol dehydrogenase YqhD (iron-dependent ADH family)